MDYSFKEVESKWQEQWKKDRLYQTDEDSSKPKYYVLEQFPYPSGDGLHMGHIRVYSIGDVVARFWRMRGYRVLHPMGADSFGLPAENAAIQRGENPREWTLRNMDRFVQEQTRMGLSYDWDRYISSCLPDFIRGTQWLFLFFLEKGLAYRKKASVNWCPSCATVLANEQVEDGLCWRCESEVTKKELNQWFLRITDYAERLLEGLDRLPKWPQKVKTMQKHWIGKSEGVLVDFPLLNQEGSLRAFTTRVDTLFGVTYVVVAPEHPLLPQLIQGNENEEAILDFVEQTKKLKEIERSSTETEKVGYATGSYVKHPFTGEPVPIWVANYVLMDYGTGVVMGVPAHDERDFSFAHKYDLPIKEVVNSPESPYPEKPYMEDGLLINSGAFDGIGNREAISAIVEALEKEEQGKAHVTYRLRDWLISRQRYWGAPIPVVYCENCGIVPVPASDLPVLLPQDVVFDGKNNPLSTSEEFLATRCPSCKGQARRETDTMDTFIDSSWYFLRYTDTQNQELPFDPSHANSWLPVNEYVGGIEHAVLHLLYSRFFTKVLFDAGMLNVDEPFESLLTQGMVLKEGAKMSKSKGNTVSPLDIIDQYGADTARLFILFSAPPERDLEWSDQGVRGSFRFLQRVWRLVDQYRGLWQQELPDRIDEALNRKVHQTVQKVTVDVAERHHFNTAISAMMELVNELYLYDQEPSTGFRQALETLTILLAPFVPHITEEMWSLMGKKESVHVQPWPKVDAKALTVNEKEIVVQVGGKVKGTVRVSATATKEDMEKAALEAPSIQRLLADKKVQRVIVVPGRLVNIVISG